MKSKSYDKMLQAMRKYIEKFGWIKTLAKAELLHTFEDLGLKNSKLVSASWGYLVFAECAVLFGVMYAILVSMVYYTQIAIVLKGTLSTDLLMIVSDIPGSVFFYIDMFGYCFLCLATLFIAFAIEGNKLLRGFLFAHSAIFILTFLLPFMPIAFSTVQPAAGEVSGPLIFVLWCAIFVPVCLLLTRYFSRQQT